MEDFGYPSDENLQPSAKLSLFFKGVATTLQRLRERTPKQLADESRKICAGVLQKVLMKVAAPEPRALSAERSVACWRRCFRQETLSRLDAARLSC